jgi:predicted transcriptional regulator of viral defense system
VERRRKSKLPWDLLFELAVAQSGHFTTQQATELGFSEAVLTYHQRMGKLRRPVRGVYRFSQYPATDHEEFVVVWLASGREGVFSHETALALHQLSDALPTRLHLTLPRTWQRRSLPEGIARHYASVAAEDIVWIGPVRVTSVPRTLRDCASAHVAPDVLAQALQQAIARGKVSATQLPDWASRLGAAPAP